MQPVDVLRDDPAAARPPFAARPPLGARRWGARRRSAASRYERAPSSADEPPASRGTQRSSSATGRAARRSDRDSPGFLTQSRGRRPTARTHRLDSTSSPSPPVTTPSTGSVCGSAGRWLITRRNRAPYHLDTLRAGGGPRPSRVTVPARQPIGSSTENNRARTALAEPAQCRHRPRGGYGQAGVPIPGQADGSHRRYASSPLSPKRSSGPATMGHKSDRQPVLDIRLREL